MGKMEKVDVDSAEYDMASLYVNVFARRGRLSCFAAIVTDEQPSDTVTDVKNKALSQKTYTSDKENNQPEDFGKIIDSTLTKKKSGKGGKKKHYVIMVGTDVGNQKAIKNFDT